MVVQVGFTWLDTQISEAQPQMAKSQKNWVEVVGGGEIRVQPNLTQSPNIFGWWWYRGRETWMLCSIRTDTDAGETIPAQTTESNPTRR